MSLARPRAADKRRGERPERSGPHDAASDHRRARDAGQGVGWWPAASREHERSLECDGVRPRYIHDLSQLRAIVVPGVTQESEYLEFKTEVPIGEQPPAAKKIERQLEFCRDVSQFANSRGGCLLIGISERKDPATGLTVAGELVGVASAEALVQQIEEALARHLVPASFRREVVKIVVPDVGTVVAINVPASERPVVVWNREQRWSQCYRRSAVGKVALHPEEFEALLMDNARSMRLRLERLLTDLSRPIALHSEVWEFNRSNRWTRNDEVAHNTILLDYRAHVTAVGESEFTVSIDYVHFGAGRSASINVPYGFIEEVWLDEAGVVTLSLERKLVLGHDGRLLLERRPRGQAAPGGE